MFFPILIMSVNNKFNILISKTMQENINEWISSLLCVFKMYLMSTFAKQCYWCNAVTYVTYVHSNLFF